MNTSEMKIVQTQAVYNRLFRDSKRWLKEFTILQEPGLCAVWRSEPSNSLPWSCNPPAHAKAWFLHHASKGRPFISKLSALWGPPGPQRWLFLWSLFLAAQSSSLTHTERTTSWIMMGLLLSTF